ncbi:hypothetical protein [Rhodopirellula europaea]|nr:hypothetical protein [Rhodopirellula europaea]
MSDENDETISLYSQEFAELYHSARLDGRALGAATLTWILPVWQNAGFPLDPESQLPILTRDLWYHAACVTTLKKWELLGLSDHYGQRPDESVREFNRFLNRVKSGDVDRWKSSEGHELSRKLDQIEWSSSLPMTSGVLSDTSTVVAKVGTVDEQALGSLAELLMDLVDMQTAGLEED